MDDTKAEDTIFKDLPESIVDQNNNEQTESLLDKADITKEEKDSPDEVVSNHGTVEDIVILKEGTINAQDDSGEWVPCHITVTNQGITLSFAQQLLQNEQKGTERVDEVMEFSSPDDEVVIEMLPDHARRSRESKLFPFAVKKQKIARKTEMKNEEEEEKKQEDDEEVIGKNMDDSNEEPSSIERLLDPNRIQSASTSVEKLNDYDETSELPSKTGGIARQRDEVILATSNGREMWKWATTIRWLGNPPVEKKIPLFEEPATIMNRNPHYLSPNTLQNALLEMFTYKNLPSEPVHFDDLARVDRVGKHRTRLRFAYFPPNFFPEAEDRNYSRDYDDYDSEGSSDDSDEETDEEHEEEEEDNEEEEEEHEEAANDHDIENSSIASIKEDNDATSEPQELEPPTEDTPGTSGKNDHSIDGQDDLINKPVSAEGIVSDDDDVKSLKSEKSMNCLGEAINVEEEEDVTNDVQRVPNDDVQKPAIVSDTEINDNGIDDSDSNASPPASPMSNKADNDNTASNDSTSSDYISVILSNSKNETVNNEELDNDQADTHNEKSKLQCGVTVPDDKAQEDIESDTENKSDDDIKKPKEEEEEKKEDTKEVPPIIENHEHVFGLFAYIVLVGACVQVNEKCFELITSANLFDLSTQGTWKGNSPFSMLCEGDYNTSRNYMVKSLWKLGYPKLHNFYANCTPNMAFSIFISKPDNLWGIGGVTGLPVHPDDQKLCRLLRDNGDGLKENQELTDQFVHAMSKNETEFRAHHRQKITEIHIPKSIQQWGCTQLTKLDLHYNGIFELPDELYDFTSLTHLDLSGNCLFGLSHKLANLTNLQSLDIHCNLITELPDTIDQLENITEFECYSNPLSKPPSEVWNRGITHVRNFFRDMRESGTEVNVDLRVLVLGLSEAGKTSLINGLIDPSTRALTRIGDRTVGIEKRTWVMERGSDQEPVNLLTYDFAGQEEYYVTHHLFLGNRALYILAFDLSKYKDELLDSQILLWWESIQDRVCDVKSNDSKTPKVIIVGTHADMVDDAQDIADNILKILQKRNKADKKHVKDRMKELKKILDKLDPRKAKAEDKDDVEKFEKKYEKLPIEKKMEILRLENEIKKLNHQQQCKIALPEEIHAVSSLDLQNFDKFREQIANSITEVGPSGKYFPQVDEHLPASWFRVRKFVRDQSTRKGRECMKLPQYFKLLSDELGINEDVGRRATNFCHELGDVLFFDKVGLVFLRPSFLIDVFKLIIRHDHRESTYFTEEMLKNGISEDQFNKGKDLLLQKGELEEWLLDILWSNLDDDIGPESSIKNNLIQLLETFDVATPIEHEGRQRLLIPEFQPKSLDLQWPKRKAEEEFEIQRLICVDHTLPHGLLKRIQVRIIKKIYKRNGTSGFHLSQNQFHIQDSNAIELYCEIEKEIGDCSDELGTSEGVRLYIRGKDKQRVLSLLSRVYSCVEETLREFPGLVFDHYAVHNLKRKQLCINLEELKAKQDAGETMINGMVPIDDLIPSRRSMKGISRK